MELTAMYTLKDGECVTQRDDALDAMAAKFGGERTSSGYLVPTGERDIQYEFGSAEQATEFAIEAKKSGVAVYIEPRTIHIGLGLYVHLSTGPGLITNSPDDDGDEFGEIVESPHGGYVLQDVAEELMWAKNLRVIADFLEWMDYHEGNPEGFPEPSQTWRPAPSIYARTTARVN